MFRRTWVRAAVAAVATVLNQRAGGLSSIVAGVILLGQIAGEILLLAQPGQPSTTEISYLVVALLMLVLGWLAARRTASSRPTLWILRSREG